MDIQEFNQCQILLDKVKEERDEWKARAKKAEADWQTERNMFKEFAGKAKDRENALVADRDRLREALRELIRKIDDCPASQFSQNRIFIIAYGKEALAASEWKAES